MMNNRITNNYQILILYNIHIISEFCLKSIDDSIPFTYKNIKLNEITKIK